MSSHTILEKLKEIVNILKYIFSSCSFAASLGMKNALDCISGILGTFPSQCSLKKRQSLAACFTGALKGNSDRKNSTGPCHRAAIPAGAAGAPVLSWCWCHASIPPVPGEPRGAGLVPGLLCLSRAGGQQQAPSQADWG